MSPDTLTTTALPQRPQARTRERPWAETRFRAMGTDAHVLVVGRDARAISSRIQDQILQLERTWSRFLPTSEISRINEAEGRATIVSPPTFELLERGVVGWQLTGGRFDPFMETAITEAGYDRSFETLDSTRRPASRCRASSGADGVRLEPSQRLAQLPVGRRFDPGAIAKGLAADMVSRAAMADGATGVLVNIGGDLRVRGEPPRPGDWVVALREPSISDATITTVRLRDAGLATSTVCRRRWSSPDGERHHVIDPATSRPSNADVDLVSVIAADAWWAEVSATALLVDPSTAGSAMAAETNAGVPHLIMRHDGRVERGGEFERWEQ